MKYPLSNHAFRCAVGLFVLAVATGLSGATFARDGLSPSQIIDAMRARAITAATRMPPDHMPTLTGTRLTRWPGNDMTFIPWNGKALSVAGDLRNASGRATDRFARGRSVTYTPTLRSTNSITVSTVTDSARVEVLQTGTGPNSQLTVFVNGFQVNRTPTRFPADGGLYATMVDFGKPARRELRFLFNDPLFAGLLIDHGASAAPPPRQGRFRAMFLGDSYTESGQCWAMIAAYLLGWDDTWLSGVGGTGYINTGRGGLNFLGRLDTDVIAYRPDVLVVSGGLNDSGFPPKDLEKAAAALFDRITRELPDTVVFVLGPWSPRSAVRPEINAALLTAASGRPNFHWVPNYDDHWITGTGRDGAPTGDGNSDVMIGGDGTHPTPEGHRYLAQRFATYMRRMLGLTR